MAEPLGTWGAGPSPGTLCEVCAAPLEPNSGEFLGQSNGDYAWCCNLTCLIALAEAQRSLYADGVGPSQQNAEAVALRWTVERERNWADDGDVCSVPDCGVGFDDIGYLIDITVLTSPGEEGYAEVTQWFCQEHYEEIAPKLMALGFMSHNHHGTNLLDAETCGGYGKCPHPVEYGAELVVPNEPAHNDGSAAGA